MPPTNYCLVSTNAFFGNEPYCNFHNTAPRRNQSITTFLIRSIELTTRIHYTHNCESQPERVLPKKKLHKISRYIQQLPSRRCVASRRVEAHTLPQEWDEIIYRFAYLWTDGRVGNNVRRNHTSMHACKQSSFSQCVRVKKISSYYIMWMCGIERRRHLHNGGTSLHCTHIGTGVINMLPSAFCYKRYKVFKK